MAQIKPNTFKPGQSGNPKGRPSGLATVRKLLDPNREELVAKVLEMAKGGNEAALRIIFDRIAPLPRAQFEPMAIPGFIAAKTMVEKAQTVVDAMGAGSITADAAALFLSAMASAVAIKQDDQLAAEIETLRAAVERLQHENK